MSCAERQGPRMVRLKKAQTQLALTAAHGRKRVADEQRAEAGALSLSAAETLSQALMQPEQGLTRSALFDRLRSVAVSRAHALEARHAAGELEALALQLQQQEQAFRVQAASHQRKQQKLEQWQSRRVAEEMRRRERRRHIQEQEDFPCHRRFNP